MSRPYRDSTNFIAFLFGIALVTLFAFPVEAASVSDQDLQQQTAALELAIAETQHLFVKAAHVVLFGLGFIGGIIR